MSFYCLIVSSEVLFAFVEKNTFFYFIVKEVDCATLLYSFFSGHHSLGFYFIYFEIVKNSQEVAKIVYKDNSM